MIARASSGSRSSISSVEPLISANSAVTVLRSPSIASDVGAASAVTLIGDSEELAGGKSGRAAASTVPHFLQNRAPGLANVLQVGQASSSFAPHPSQNDASAGLSLLHFVQSIWLRAKLLKQGLSVLQIGSIEAFSEPAVDLGEHRARFGGTPLLREQSREAHNRAQLQRLGSLRVRYVERLSEATLRTRPVGCPLHQQELALEPV